ncbi:four helix bundle protein [bacterium]|nr:four helix bundle protein [bacterium]
MRQGKIVKFTDLIAWQEGHKLLLMTYRELAHFPKDERFGLIDQMRRCIISITSNIAEGFSRNTLKDKNHFYYMALGSVTELQNQLIIARDVKYLESKIFSFLAEQTVLVHKLINGLIKSNKKKLSRKK